MWLSVRGASGSVMVIVFAGCFVAIAIVGFIDDHRPLAPWPRLAVHIAASALFSLALLGSGASAFEATAAFVACVVLTNVWNFMDGINGLAASQAAIAASWLALQAAEPWSWLALAMSAACAGFLPFNFPRARIFLGDVGSGAIGFAIAATAIGSLPQDRVDHLPVLLLVSPFLLDSGLTLARRVVRGEHWWTAHTQHAYQACARRWGHAPTTVGYAAWAVAPLTLLLGLDTSEVFRQGFVVAWYICGALLWLVLQTYGSGSVEGKLAGNSSREGDSE